MPATLTGKVAQPIQNSNTDTGAKLNYFWGAVSILFILVVALLFFKFWPEGWNPRRY